MNGLRDELARVGITGRLARRIELELDDHARCAPDAQLGSPQLIAERFADELRLPRTRRATYAGFGALALTALLLAVPQRGVSAAGGWPDVFGTRGLVASLGGLAIALAAQVACVAGVLALGRLFWRPNDLRLVQRRTAVALAAGAAVLAGETVQAVAVQPQLPTWWFALALAAVAVPAVALGGAAHELRAAGAITPAAPSAAQGFPPKLVLAIGASVVFVMAAGSTVAERSWVEGAWRAGIELVAFTLGFLALGRRLGIRR